MRTVRVLLLCGLFTTVFLLAGNSSVLLAAPFDPDEELLQQAKVRTRTSDLIGFLTAHSGDDADLQRLDALIGQLGSKKFDEREHAGRRLIALGWRAQEAVRKATIAKDLETARQAKACLEQIQQEGNWVLPLAAVRLLVRRQAVEAIPALLRYLPYAADEETVEETWYGLDALTVRERAVVPALRDALKDTLPARRAAAACIVGRRGNAEQQADVRKLLADADPMVRLRAAQGLLAAKDKTGIPVLIALLNESAVEVSWQAEELLHWMAGVQAPSATVGEANPEVRVKCRSAWEGWWRERGTQLDLATVWQEPRRPGLVLVCDRGVDGKGWVSLHGCDGKPRWRMTGLSHHPTDARLLSENRVLIGEWAGHGATVRELDGNVREQITHKGQSVDVCQRLPNGNWFLLSNDTILEWGPGGKEVRNQQFREQPGTTFRPLARLRFGQVVVYEKNQRDEENLITVSTTGQRVITRQFSESLKAKPFRLDTHIDGKFLLTGLDPEELQILDVSSGIDRRVSLAGVQAKHAVGLRNGNLLVVGQRAGVGVVAEVHPDGRFFRQAAVVGPTCVRPCLGLVRLGFDEPFPVTFDLAAEIRRKRIEEARKKEEPYLRELAEQLNDPDSERCFRAMKAISEYGEIAIPYLLRAVKHPNAKVRCDAIWGFTASKTLFFEGKEIVTALNAAINDDDRKVRETVANVLGGFPSEGEQVVPVLMKALKDPDSMVRNMAMHSLGRMGLFARPAVPLMLEHLKGEDLHLRHWTAVALKNLGPVDKSIPRALIEALDDKEVPSVRESAALALARWDIEASVPALVRALLSKDVRDPERANATRKGIVTALGLLGSRAKIAVPTLIDILKDEQADLSLRVDVARCLGQIGDAASDAIPVLEKTKVDRSLLGLASSTSLKKIRGGN